MSVYGEGDTLASQAVTAVNKLIYKWYNDGDVYDNVNSLVTGWANDVSSFANWLYNNILETKSILEKIFEVTNDNQYEGILKSLADLIFNEDFLKHYEKETQGSIYECDGPFKFDDSSENEEDFEDYDDEEEDDYDYTIDESKNLKTESANNTNTTKLKLDVSDPDKNIRKLLEYISDLSTQGHSFRVIVDPDDSEFEKSFGIDGDGCDQIYSIQVCKDSEDKQ